MNVPNWTMPTLSCFRCNHNWIPRAARLPKSCPRCHSPYWDRPRMRKAKDWVPTHRIVVPSTPHTPTKVYTVMLKENGYAYSKEEWTSGDDAEWTLDAHGWKLMSQKVPCQIHPMGT